MSSVQEEKGAKIRHNTKSGVRSGTENAILLLTGYPEHGTS